MSVFGFAGKGCAGGITGSSERWAAPEFGCVTVFPEPVSPEPMFPETGAETCGLISVDGCDTVASFTFTSPDCGWAVRAGCVGCVVVAPVPACVPEIGVCGVPGACLGSAGVEPACANAIAGSNDKTMMARGKQCISFRN